MEASRQKDGASRDGTTFLYCTPHPKFDCGVLIRPVRRLGCLWIDINGDVGFQVEAHFFWLRSSSMTLGTRRAWIRLGGRDKLIEDGLDCSIDANTYRIAEQNGNAFIDLKPPTQSDPCVNLERLTEQFSQD